MKLRLASLIVLVFISLCSFAQEAELLMKEALKLEQQLKDTLAIGKYAKAFVLQPKNINAAIKCAEMNCSIGARQTNLDLKKKYFADAKTFASTALALDSNNADANYINAVVYGKLTEVETSNEKLVEAVKNIKLYADKALKLNPNHGKAWYVMGKWHYEVLNLNAIKKAAVKLFYGGLPTATLNEAIICFEKCKQLQPYFAMNYLALAKAYEKNKQYEKCLAALAQCAKCPSLLPEDKAIKAEAKALTVKWQ
jgi:tetratricopeptide (TPR) repeat protein